MGGIHRSRILKPLCSRILDMFPAACLMMLSQRFPMDQVEKPDSVRIMDGYESMSCCEPGWPTCPPTTWSHANKEESPSCYSPHKQVNQTWQQNIQAWHGDPHLTFFLMHLVPASWVNVRKLLQFLAIRRSFGDGNEYACIATTEM